MTEHVLPSIVNVFVEELRIFLDDYKVTLILKENLLKNDQPALIYEISGAPWSPSLFIHQTQRSLDSANPEYRVRLGTTLPDEIANLIRGIEGIANRYASLSAIVSSERTVDVVSQSILSEQNASQVAYMMSIAAMYGALTITESLRKEEEGIKPKVDELSAWTDLDFEQVHYDFAHLGIGQLGQRQWTMRTLFGHLELLANHSNPYWNAGLLSLAYYSKEQLGIAEVQVTSNDLNQMSFMLDETPMFGAWCDKDDYLVFVTFIPNFMKSLPEITEQLISWFMQRSRSINLLVPELKIINEK